MAKANKCILSGIARDGTPPSTSWLEKWDNSVISTLVLLLLTLPALPDGISKGV
jgi:hypothetical protein